MGVSQSETELESPRKQVQEIAANCDKPPERYIYKEDEEYGGVNGAGLSPPTITDIPVIDVSLLDSSPAEVDKLKSALSAWGCCQTINHGIEGSFLEEVRGISRGFFGLPVEEKKKYLKTEDDVEGYGNDQVLSDNQILDWNDRLYLTVLPKDRRRLQFWPQNPNHFREILDEFSSKVQLINEVVLKTLARSLNLEENCFWDQYGKTATMNARFNNYPRCPCPNKVLGVKAHTDGTAITILLQDKEVEGLQILKDDRWVGVPLVDDALIIIAGDQIEIMSNGIFKGAMHRVTPNSEKERMTLAMFCYPQTEKDIGPVEELVTDERPRLYKNVTFSLDFYLEVYQQGKSWIDVFKI